MAFLCALITNIQSADLFYEIFVHKKRSIKYVVLILQRYFKATQ